MAKLVITRSRYRPPLTVDHLKAIGMVVAEAASLEATMEIATWGLLNVDEDQGRAVTTPLGFQPRLDLLLSLLEKAQINQLTKGWVKARVSEARQLYNQRTQIVHGVWMPGSRQDTARPQLYRSKKGVLKLRGQEMGAPQIAQIAEQISKLSDDFLHFIDANDAFLPPLLRKSR